MVVETIEGQNADAQETEFQFLYPDTMPLAEKIETICREIYGADGVDFEKKAGKKLDQFEEMGFGRLPVCIAKTQYSFSSDPTLRGCPKGFRIPIRDVKISAGAGFIVALAGEIMTMPGLSKSPAAERIDVDEYGQIVGLF